MLTTLLTKLVDASRRYALYIVVAAAILSLGMAGYVAGHIRINTDINQLLSDNLPWRQREKALDAAFPQKTDNLIIVIDSKDPVLAEAAAATLEDRLEQMPDIFTVVSRPDALPFFRANGLLYLKTSELGAILDQIAQTQPMLATIAGDPSLRGFFNTIGLMMQAVQSSAVDRAQVEPPLKAITETTLAALKGEDKPLDWKSMVPDASAAQGARQLRKYIITKPVLHYGDLQPGAVATAAIRQAAAELGIAPENGVTMRLTGPVALNDQEFASVANGAGFATLLSAGMVLCLLFLAMRSWRIVAPIAITLCVGLIATTAFATVAIGSLNLISVAFAVMFIGIAVDFGIQFGVRYRDQHHRFPDHAKALARTASVIAVPLAMAAGSTTLGFLSFIPTTYRGVSELGLIAGAGMIIAFLLNITLLPALMTLIKPGAEKETIGYAALAPLNAYLQSHRKSLLTVIAVVTTIGLAIATQVRFDFDPLDLKDPKSESVSTMFDAMKDPDSDAYAAQILAPSRQAALDLAAKFEQNADSDHSVTIGEMPVIDHVMTLASFVPEDQDKKLAMIADTAGLLGPTMNIQPQPAPTDEQNLQAIRRVTALLHQSGDKIPAAQFLGTALDKVIEKYTPDLLHHLQQAIVTPLRAEVGQVIDVLHARHITLDDVPEEINRDWVTPDGRWLVEVFPKRDGAKLNDLKTLSRFIDQVQTIAPEAAGAPVSIRESGRTIISAFVHAGIYGLVSISLLALAVLRKPRDVAIMIVPLLIAGILTLATITLIGLPLNFANIIALPLLLSLGVSYAIYFVSYWRSGNADLLQSSMARAILFSAATVLVAFVSLCFSSHPGTRGMGELLTIALLYSLASTFFILPVLLGSPRTDKP